jgi:general secretion pathway protein D
MPSSLSGTSLPGQPAPAVQAVQPLPPSQPAFPATAVPGPPMPPGAKQPPPPPGQKFVLNFDNADLYEVIRVMSQMMKVNYIIDPRVKGIVNIHTSGQIGQEELFPIFQTILKLNGATAVQRGNIFEIVPFLEAKKLAVEPLKTKDSGKSLPDEKYSIQIIPLKYIPVTEVTKILKPFLSDGADIVEHPPQNILVIGDIASNIRKSVSIIELFDMDIFASQSVRIYPVRNADVNEVAKEMERIFSSFEVSLKSGRGVGITFTPIPRINSLLVVSGIPNIFEKVESWLSELDRIPSEGSKLNVFVYYVQNGKAKDLADVLKQIYVSPKDKKTEFKEKVTPTPPAAPRSVRPTTPAVTATKEETGTGGVVEGDINIVVDENTNALIIRAFQRDYHAIVETIKKLDLYPKQVLIEVLLAEVTLDESTKYGLEWSTFSDAFVKGGRTYAYTVGMGGVAPAADLVSGLRYSITSVDRLAAAIHASATDNRLKVITSPHIMASNNKEAKIQIGSSQPILTNTYTTSAYTSTSTGVVEGTIEYKDIGVILSVTPRISDGKLVTMDINIEQSSVDNKTLGSLSAVPFFPKKTAKTTLSIMEGQTIVIGGLLDDTKNVQKSGVPFLSKIPILGALFGYHQYTDSGTETILMLTPHVISDLIESNRVTQEFRDKVGAIKRELESIEKKRMKDVKKEQEKTLPSPNSSITP